MPDILLFGATGYTGRLAAEALARKGASFAIAGRNKAKLYALADEVGGPEVRVASVGDVDALVAALEDVKVLITTVGPFTELGETAVEAALRAKVHYIDSTGEGPFIGRLIQERDEAAREAGIVMAPSMGFDEVPADVAATLATEGTPGADLVLSYALPRTPSKGTLRSTLGIVTSEGPWIENGQTRMIRAGDEHRWAPMPPPLGPKSSVSFPLAEGRLAPLHLDLQSLRIFVTSGTLERFGIKYGLGPLKKVLETSWGQWAFEKAIAPLREGPDDERRHNERWTILAEASSGRTWRNVALTGSDVYGLTAEFLTTAAMKLAHDGATNVGVCAPVQAVGLETLQKELIDHGASIDIYESR